jgi:branched-chain amino acid transport system substrate-binding protein
VIRRLAAGFLVAAAVLVGGCRDTADSTSTGGTTLSVYSLLPLQGPAAPVSRDVVDGEKLALRDAQGLAGTLAVNFRSVDSAATGTVTPGSVAAAARKAAQDPSAIAAVGALDAGEAEVEIPLLNEASLALVTPAVTDLAIAEPRLYPTGLPTLARVVGDDASQARAVATLARRLRCRRPALVTGPSPGERLLARAVGSATRGAPSSGRPCSFLAINHIHAGVRAARRLAPRTVIAPAALAVPAFTRALGAAAERSVRLVVPVPEAGAAVSRAFARTFGRPAGREALLGYDAMRAVLAAVRQAGPRGNDRAAVARALTGRRVDRWASATVRRGEIAIAPS